MSEANESSNKVGEFKVGDNVRTETGPQQFMTILKVVNCDVVTCEWKENGEIVVKNFLSPCLSHYGK